MTPSARRQRRRLLAPIALLVFATVSLVGPVAAAQVDGCPPVEPAAAPHAILSNGAVSAVLLLPDTQNGYYRGTRFDWSGVVWCLTFKGHHYFGIWNQNTDPKSGNAITGPVEEFSALGYERARPGDLFVKPGVGVLRRVGAESYSFNGKYPIVDSGKWTVRTGKRQVTYRHNLKSPIGIAYVYEKRLSLDAREPMLLLEHQLKNTGKAPIDIQVYDHDFFVIDATRTGPDMTLRFPFAPTMDKPLLNGARVEARQVVYDRELADGQTAAANITTGFSNSAADFHFVVENTRTGVGVEEIGDQPVTKIVFWSNPRTVAPEAYFHLTIAPGKTGRWSIRYRFFARDPV